MKEYFKILDDGTLEKVKLKDLHKGNKVLLKHDSILTQYIYKCCSDHFINNDGEQDMLICRTHERFDNDKY